jgi:hypothetical protein
MLDKILDFYNNLKKEDLDSLEILYERDAYFKDPFNETRSLNVVKEVFTEMFDRLETPRFVIVDKVVERKQIFLTWDFLFSLNNKKYKIHGSSFLKLNEKGKIFYHRDYWDVGEEILLKIPVVNSLYSILVKKIKVNSISK